jgi:hypothetical protein
MNANPKVIAFDAELAKAEEIAAARRAIPELTADEILAGFKTRELKEAVIDGFGRVFYFHPMTASERFEILAKLEGGDTITAKDLAQIVIARTLDADGHPKFSPDHAAALLEAPAASLEQLAGLLFKNRVTLASAEKK